MWVNGPLADINVEKPREAQISTYEAPSTPHIHRNGCEIEYQYLHIEARSRAHLYASICPSGTYVLRARFRFALKKRGYTTFLHQNGKDVEDLFCLPFD